MKHVVLLPIIAASVIASRTCFKSSRTVISDDVFEEQMSQPPAANAADWIKRFPPGKSLTRGFEELPPPKEWEAIVQKLRQPGHDPRTIKIKIRLMGDVLAEDAGAASEDIRALLLTNKDGLDSGSSRDEALGYLHTFSKDPDETRRWVEKYLPKEKPDGYTYSSKNSSKNSEITQLLARNEVDAAVGKLRSKIDSDKDLSDKISNLCWLARVARLTDRKPLYEKTVGEMKDIAMRIPLDRIYGAYYLSDVFVELVNEKDWEAIRRIATRYRDRKHAGFEQICLAATYEIDGPAAFLAGLRTCPEHGVEDRDYFLEFITNDIFPIGERTIRSYMASGERENARITLSYLLALDMGNDAYYRLAIEFFPEEAEMMFESLRPYNSYEERPLIWLAELALRKNDLERARALIDQAIALDPSDGEQGKDSRMQAYDVLSRILREKGDVQKADFFNQVTQSIRRGEQADDYRVAGLLQEATRRYQEALGQFADAYCLQSRLAKSLLEAGKDEEAMLHFEKAFELMPVSFGPVENMCFGCERIFADKRVQQVALKTFNRIIETTPQNPRTFYFLGILCEEMKMPEQAMAAFKKGLELDPRYYNCANKLMALQLANPDTAGEARDTQRRIVAMAPYEDLQKIYRARTDLRQAWLDAQAPPPAPLKLEPLPLPFKAGTEGSAGAHPFYMGGMLSLDGWSTRELLDNNAFLEWIDTF